MKKKIVVLTGAGVSAESGISTFRDAGGLWDNYNAEDVASIEGWHRNPGLMLDFYNARRSELKDVTPNAAHLAIAGLEKDFDVSVVTQNIDNLHERAGSSDILHLHGELTKVRPEDCYNEADGFSTKYVSDIGYSAIYLGDVGVDGAQLRPHIVWFGEPVPNIGKAAAEVEEADVLLIVGTSLQVYPAAGLYRYAASGTPIYIIDPSPLKVSDPRLIHIQEVATYGMETFKNILKSK